MKKITQFFKDSYAELRKVVWPTGRTSIASTKVVLVSTLIDGGRARLHRFPPRRRH